MQRESAPTIRPPGEDRSVAGWPSAEVEPSVDAHLFETGGKRRRPGLAVLVGRRCDAPAGPLPDALDWFPGSTGREARCELGVFLVGRGR